MFKKAFIRVGDLRIINGIAGSATVLTPDPRERPIRLATPVGRC